RYSDSSVGNHVLGDSVERCPQFQVTATLRVSTTPLRIGTRARARLANSPPARPGPDGGVTPLVPLRLAAGPGPSLEWSRRIEGSWSVSMGSGQHSASRPRGAVGGLSGSVGRSLGPVMRRRSGGDGSTLPLRVPLAHGGVPGAVHRHGHSVRRVHAVCAG